MLHRSQLVDSGARILVSAPTAATRRGRAPVHAVEQPLELRQPGGPLPLGCRHRSRLVHDRDVMQVGGAQLARVGLQRWISLARPLHEPLNVPPIGLPPRQADRTRFELELPAQPRHSRAVARRFRQPLAPGCAATRIRIDARDGGDERGTIPFLETGNEPLGKQLEHGAVRDLGGVKEVADADAVVI